MDSLSLIFDEVMYEEEEMETSAAETTSQPGLNTTSTPEPMPVGITKPTVSSDSGPETVPATPMSVGVSEPTAQNDSGPETVATKARPMSVGVPEPKASVDSGPGTAAGTAAAASPMSVGVIESTTQIGSGPETVRVCAAQQPNTHPNGKKAVVLSEQPSTSKPKGNAGSIKRREKTTGVDCSLCKRMHPLRACFRFKKLKHADRLRHVLIFGYCARCLGHSHMTKDCPSQSKCRICQDVHHTTLHDHSKVSKRQSGQRKKTSSPPSRPQPAVVQVPVRPSIAFSPTLRVKIALGKREVDVRAVLDFCCSHSYICEQLVRKINIPVYKINSDTYCRFEIRSTYDPGQKITLNAKVMAMKGVKTPLEDVSPCIRDHYDGFPLADPEFFKSDRVALVLGPEVSPSILKGKLHSSPGFPLAQLTIFGWVISGVSPI